LDVQSVIGQIFLQIALILLNATFVCAEVVVISTNDSKLTKMANDGDKRAVRLKKLTNHPVKFLDTMQIVITMAVFLGSAFAAKNFSGILVNWLVSIGVTLPVNTISIISTIGITIILGCLTLVFGELVPKKMAIQKAESLALSMSFLITLISKLLAPIVLMLIIVTNVVLKIIGIDPNTNNDDVSEEKIRMMVDVGTINQDEKEIINNLFEFDDLTAEEFLTHRTEMRVLWLDESVEEWDKTIQESFCSLYPICDDNMDNVIGILSTKHYFRLKNKGKDNIFEKAVKPVFFVPQSICADILFKQMKNTKNRLSIVLDEYGGVLGLVTINDILEQIVGDLEDEEDSTKLIEIKKIDDDMWKLEGNVPLVEVEEILDVKLPTDEFGTFGGLVFSEYGFIPDDGEQFEISMHGLHIKVLEILDHRLKKAIVSKNLKIIEKIQENIIK